MLSIYRHVQHTAPVPLRLWPDAGKDKPLAHALGSALHAIMPGLALGAGLGSLEGLLHGGWLRLAGFAGAGLAGGALLELALLELALLELALLESGASGTW